MELLYKKQLLQAYKNDHFKDGFWERQITDYAESLGFESSDFYSCLNFLNSLVDASYCGTGKNPKGEFFIYDNNEFFWFINPHDAAMFVNQLNGMNEEDMKAGDPDKQFSFASCFTQHRKRYHNKVWWFIKEDYDYLDELIDQPLLLYCEETGNEFETVEQAAMWLADTGRASNYKTALRQLNKHLEGRTQGCYTLTFVWR